MESEEIFIFFSPSKEVREEIQRGMIPSGYYTSQDQWMGDRWVTHYWWEGVESEEGFYLEGEKIGPLTQVQLS